jgi:muconolactone delta-isomerase
VKFPDHLKTDVIEEMRAKLTESRISLMNTMSDLAGYSALESKDFDEFENALQAMSKINFELMYEVDKRLDLQTFIRELADV